MRARAFDRICRRFAATRPTAVNLFWAIERMRRAFGRARGRSAEVVREMLRQEAIAIYHEDIASNRALGKYGAALLRAAHRPCSRTATPARSPRPDTAPRSASSAPRTRPASRSPSSPPRRDRFLQGARLTAWELKKDRIPVTLITDGMVGHFMKRGADRRGDRRRRPRRRQRRRREQDRHVSRSPCSQRATGSRSTSRLPTSTIDPRLPELATPFRSRNAARARSPTSSSGRSRPSGIKVMNPAFDVTPHGLVTAIITERGVVRAPYTKSLARLLGHRSRATCAGASAADSGGGRLAARRARAARTAS